MEFGDLKKTYEYEAQREYDGLSSVEKSAHLLCASCVFLRSPNASNGVFAVDLYIANLIATATAHSPTKQATICCVILLTLVVVVD